MEIKFFHRGFLLCTGSVEADGTFPEAGGVGPPASMVGGSAGWIQNKKSRIN